MILSYGWGVDSTAILLRWLLEPSSRDFDLADLVVIGAMTGDEWEKTGTDVQEHVLPLLREHRVRLVQVAREQRYVTVGGGGVVVLDDSREPTEVHFAGRYRLSQEMREAGTIPQSGGARLCSVHSKGDTLDPIIARITGGSRYRHVIGFEANEPKRAAKDTGYNTALRTGEYPLIEWDWNRSACEAYIRQVTGIDWDKSACTFCPFSLANKAGRKRVLARYAETPQAGADTLMMEHVALALNPKQGLIGGDRAFDAVRDAGHEHVIAAFTAELDTTGHCVYEVRRILRAKKSDPSKMAAPARSVRTVARGPRSEMLASLAGLGVQRGLPVIVADDGIGRVWVRVQGEGFPTSEHFLVVAPDGVLDKQHANFEVWWETAGPAAAETTTGRAV